MNTIKIKPLAELHEMRPQERDEYQEALKSAIEEQKQILNYLQSAQELVEIAKFCDAKGVREGDDIKIYFGAACTARGRVMKFFYQGKPKIVYQEYNEAKRPRPRGPRKILASYETFEVVKRKSHEVPQV